MWKNGIFICIWNHYVLHNGELSFPNAWNSISLYFSQAPKTQSVALFYFSILMFTSVQSLIAHSHQRKVRPQIWTCFWAIEFQSRKSTYEQDFLPYGSSFQIRQSNMQHFQGQPRQYLESRPEWMLRGENNNSLSVPHDKFTIHACIDHLCRMLFPGGRPSYILLKFKKFNLSPSQQDPNWARHLKMPPRWFEQWQGFWPPRQTFCCCSSGIWRTDLFPSDSFRVKQQGLVILWYHLIILKSLGCITFPPGWGRCHWFQTTNSAPSVQDRKVD